MNLIHVGLPKAASTTLQNTIFVGQRDFCYIGPFNNLSNSTFPDRRAEELVMRISFEDSLVYDPTRTEALREELRQGSRPFLVSSESFTTEGWADRRLIAERLHALFAPAKILIILRAQPSMCQSMYLNALRASGDRLVSFETWLGRKYGEISCETRVDLDYDRLVRIYEEMFGAEHVVVLPFEWISDENAAFAATLADLLRMPLLSVQTSLKMNVANPRMSHRHLFAIYLQNCLPKGANLALMGRRWMPQPLYDLVRGFIVSGRRVESPVLPDGWTARIAALCATGNAALAARRNLPLGALGYPVTMQ